MKTWLNDEMASVFHYMLKKQTGTCHRLWRRLWDYNADLFL